MVHVHSKYQRVLARKGKHIEEQEGGGECLQVIQNGEGARSATISWLEQSATKFLALPPLDDRVCGVLSFVHQALKRISILQFLN